MVTEFLVMLIGYCDVKYKDVLDKLVEKGTLSKSVFSKYDMVLSNNTKNLVAKILLESDKKANGNNKTKWQTLFHMIGIGKVFANTILATC